MAKKSNTLVSWWKDVRKRVAKLNKKKALSFLAAEVPQIQHDKKKQHMEVDITPLSVAKGAAVAMLTILFFLFLYDISWILLLFFVAFLFAAALDPLVDFFEAHKVPRPFGMLIVYVVLFFLAGFFVSKVAGLVADQVLGIAQSVNEFVGDGNINVQGIPFGDQLQPYVQQFSQTVDVEAAAAQLQGAFTFLSNQLLGLSIGLLNLLIVLVLTFFMVVEEQSIDEFFRSVVPTRYGAYISTRIAAVKDKIGLWLRGQLMVSLIAAVLSYIGLAAMGINYALTLSLIAGVGMVVPVVGRFFAWVVTFPIVFNQSPGLALWMSIYYLIIQQFENNLIVPYVMNKAVGLNPIVIIFALLVGGHYLPVIGWVLAIPVATTVAIFLRDFTHRGKES